MFCTVSGNRVGTARLHKQNKKGVAWKEFKPEKYCPECRKRQPMKLREERHSA